MFFDDNFSANVIGALRLKENRKVRCFNDARSFCALSYRHRAQSHFEVGDKVFEANGRSIALVPAGVDYLRVSQGEDMTVIHFIPNTPVDRKIKVFYPENPIEFEKMFDKVLKVWQRKDTAYKIKCSEYLLRIACMICRECDSLSAKSTAESAGLLIERNLSNPDFSIAYVEQMLDVSGAYMRRKFKEKFSLSPSEYLVEKRMEKAVSLIETNYFRIKEVARRCGFENEKYFSTVFKKYYGVSPSEFNSNHKF